MLLTWIREVADEPLLIDPFDLRAEVRENTWRLGPTADRPAADDVVAAFEECAALLRARINAMGHEGRATFYVFHDAQAGSLKCSTTSLPADRLPFRARVELVPLAGIVEEFLSDETPGLVPWEDLEDVGPGQVADHVVRVWATEVGAGG
ncbi:hypothetical protein FKR81_25450 [Lentzea tibetensis]|uniref:Uncharacterized protein n=1 Tax=Lentzea tibetensis TaxID=2591470 RepID=A0A563EQH1_9PSEU|nr:hypothetical protein [Lentzea tibetensis]TWP49027.1 hypothetical protein FKR81_25450 [Lentzea tibetensis]